MRNIKEAMPIFIRDNLEERYEQERELKRNLIERSQEMSLKEIESEIAEMEWGAPIHLFGNIGIRPFWRDGKDAPPLRSSDLRKRSFDH